MATIWLVLVALLPTGAATAQEDSGDSGDAPAEVPSYADSELVEALRTYDLLDEWLAESPVSLQASLLRVTSDGGYQAQRKQFLDTLQSWADRTATVRDGLARIEATQADADQLRSLVGQVREALVTDDRLASESDTLIVIADALGQLSTLDIPPHPADLLAELEDVMTTAEIRLSELSERAQAELNALNGMEPAITSSGIDAFVGYEALQSGLAAVDVLIERGRVEIKPAREQSEQQLVTTLSQIPNLHASRLVGTSAVGGLSVVTVDAYIRGAARSPCGIDWALLAGIGHVESNHGRLGGGVVFGSGQVSISILGPLLDGGDSERENTVLSELEPRQWATVVEALDAAMVTVRSAVARSLGWFPGTAQLLRDGGTRGNGFAVVVDTDAGRLDGNDQWDRAVGPMQFIPETWSRWAADGNGDGRADPHNLYDAAASAGRFLCDLSTTRGSAPSSFLLGYNASTSYVRSVISAAQQFGATPLPG